MSTNLICMHTLKKQTLVILMHAHFAQILLYLVMYLVIIFFQQNKLTITFNKMITSGKSD